MKKIAWMTCMLTVSGLFLFCGPASAFNTTHLKQLLTTKHCPNCNLTGADLRKMDLKGANLRGANLIGARLEKADLHRANLCDANLSATRLNQADLSDANTDGAKFTGADLSNTLWTDGFRCKPGSLGHCRKK